MRSVVERLRHDADILDAGLAHRVHDQGKGTEGDRRIATEIDRVSLRIMHLGMNLVTQFVNVDGGVANINALRAIDGNDNARFGNLFYSFGLRHVHFDSGLQDRRRDHENHEQHKHDVHKGDDVDLRKRSAGLAAQLWHFSNRLNLKKAFKTENTEVTE